MHFICLLVYTLKNKRFSFFRKLKTCHFSLDIKKDIFFFVCAWSFIIMQILHGYSKELMTELG